MFKNLKLALKLTIGFVVVLLLSTVVTVVGIVYMNQIADSTENMYDHPYLAHTSVLRIQRNVIDIDRAIANIRLSEDDRNVQESRQDINQLETQVFEILDELYSQFTGDPALIDKVKSGIKAWKPIREEVIRLHLLGLANDAAEMNEKTNTPHVTTIEESIQDMVDFSKTNALRFKNTARNDATSAQYIVLLLLGIAYVAAFFIAFIITKGVTNPLFRLLSFTREIADGNLTIAPVDYKSRDEVGVLTQALNGMQVDLRDLTSRVLSSVSVLNSSSDQMSAATQQTSASIEQLASTANEFAVAVDRLSGNTQEMSQSAQKTNELSVQGDSDIETTIRTMNEINEVVSTLHGNIRTLGQQSEEIGQIVNLIIGIADQTNLLALNAAIEAARAGEQGRGFAVVADEVRKLAEQSGQAAGEITQLIQQVRTSAQDSVRQADLGSVKVKEGVKAVAQSGQMFKDIAHIIGSLVKEIGDIVAATQELAAGAEEMSATTEEQSASAEQMAAAAIEVAQGALQVQQQMNRFRL